MFVRASNVFYKVISYRQTIKLVNKYYYRFLKGCFTVGHFQFSLLLKDAEHLFRFGGGSLPCSGGISSAVASLPALQSCAAFDLSQRRVALVEFNKDSIYLFMAARDESTGRKRGEPAAFCF